MEKPDFSEDDRILAVLTDNADIEAFSNLMEHAHEQGISAADFIREEPRRTSRKRIRKLCLKNRKRSLQVMFQSIIKSLWDRPVTNASTAESLYGVPPRLGKPHSNGYTNKRNKGEQSTDSSGAH